MPSPVRTSPHVKSNRELQSCASHAGSNADTVWSWGLTRPSAFVRSQRGREAEDQVWREFTALWEKVAPEVKSVLSR